MITNPTGLEQNFFWADWGEYSGSDSSEEEDD